MCLNYEYGVANESAKGNFRKKVVRKTGKGKIDLDVLPL
jgi:hypothetical protein